MEESSPLMPVDGVFQDLFAAQVVPPCWIIEDLIPAGICFLVAPPKIGKSTVTMGLAAMVAGYPCNILPKYMRRVVRSGPVMVFSAEANAGELRHMVEEGLMVPGEADEGILVADDPWRFRLDDENGLAQILYWLEERKPRMFILDPLVDFHGVDENDSGEMNRLLRPLQQWAKANESCFMVVHHTRKLQEGKEVYDESDSRGTTAIHGIADCTIIFSPKKKLPGFTNVKCTPKRGQQWERIMRFGMYGEEAAEYIDDLSREVLRHLSARPAGAEGIALDMKINKRTVEEVLQRLQRNGLAVRHGDAWVSR